MRALTAFLVVGVLCPQTAEAQLVGIFADSLASTCNLTIPFPGPAVDMYVVFTPGPLADSTGGASFSIEGLPSGWSAEVFANPEGECNPWCWPFDFPGAQVSFPACQSGPVVLYRLRITPSSAVTDHELRVVAGTNPLHLYCPRTFSCGNQAGTSLPYAKARINSTMVCSPVVEGSCPWTDAADFSPGETSLVVAPNPPTQSVEIHYAVAPDLGSVRLTLYDLRGRVVTRLNPGLLRSHGSVIWDGRDAAGKAASAGIYVVRLETEGHGIVSRKIAWIR